MKQLTIKEWNNLVKNNLIREVPNQDKGFLMYGQELDVKIILNKKYYLATKWFTDSYITLKEL